MSFLNGKKSYCVRIRSLPQHRQMFPHDRDYAYFLRLLKKYKRTAAVRIFAFCFLPASADLIVQAVDPAQVNDFLNQIRRAYHIYFSVRYGRRAVFPWQKHSLMIIGQDEQLFEHIKRLELKPVLCEAVQNPTAYLWSSCSYRVLADRSGILDREVLITADDEQEALMSKWQD